MKSDALAREDILGKSSDDSLFSHHHSGEAPPVKWSRQIAFLGFIILVALQVPAFLVSFLAVLLKAGFLFGEWIWGNPTRWDTISETDAWLCLAALLLSMLLLVSYWLLALSAAYHRPRTALAVGTLAILSQVFFVLVGAPIFTDAAFSIQDIHIHGYATFALLAIPLIGALTFLAHRRPMRTLRTGSLTEW